jgi:hypothetical protein
MSNPSTRSRTTPSSTAPSTGPKPRPDFEAFTTRKRPDGQKDVWIDIGAGFLHADGAGINIILAAIPIDGRVILRPMQDRPPQTERKG